MVRGNRDSDDKVVAKNTHAAVPTATWTATRTPSDDASENTSGTGQNLSLSPHHVRFSHPVVSGKRAAG